LQRGIAVHQGESIDCEVSAKNLTASLRRALAAPERDIDNLISELDRLQEKLHTDANRIQREIMEYAELSQRVRRMATIISEAMQKIPSG
jgi:predicted  nucleic acid-binding Zn-ribbon protein